METAHPVSKQDLKQQPSPTSWKLDLGFKSLWPEWLAMFSVRHLKDDIAAGGLVASVSIPLSLALALASGMEPFTGLITAFIAGTICAIWGGTPLGISGPSNAMPVILAASVHQFGAQGIFVVGIGCGLLQLLTGVLRFGNLIRFVPFSIVAGISAGFGMILLMSQIPRALGIQVPNESQIFELILKIPSLVSDVQIPILAVTLGTLGINLIFPRFFPRLPAPLIAVIIPTAVVYFFGIQVPTLGPISHSLPSPQLPNLPKLDVEDLLTTTLTVYFIASLETLISSSSAERISKTKRTDPDQEMIGQGFGNFVTALFGGFPATGVIARTSLNIQAGAKTRRSAIFQSLLIFMVAMTCSPVISNIPIAVLTGIILSIALRMLHPREFLRLWKLSPQEATLYALTFFIIVIADLIAGIRVGIIAALVLALIRSGRSNTQWSLFSPNRAGSQRFQELKIEGSLTFQSTGKIEIVRDQLSQLQKDQGLVVNLSKVNTIDPAGATQLIDVIEPLLQKKRKVVLMGLNPEGRKTLLSVDTHHTIAKCLASSESEMMDLLYNRSHGGPLDRLIDGVERFKNEMQVGYGSLFKNLAEGQSPHTLFITCSDSRIDPNLITSTHPGELFIVRNVGNLIPPYGVDKTPAEGAAVEFAVGVLNVKEVIICGHSGCGAMKEVLQGNLIRSEKSDQFPSLKAWLQQAQSIRDQLPSDASVKQAAELNAVLQVENLKTYPLIREQLKAGKIRVHSWYYNIGDSELEEWNEERQLFVTIGSQETKSQAKRIEAGVQYQVPLVPDDDNG